MEEFQKALYLNDFENLNNIHKRLVCDIEDLKVEKLRMMNDVGNLEQVQIYQDWVLNLLDYLAQETQQQIVNAIVEQEKSSWPADQFEIVNNKFINTFKNRLKNKDWLSVREGK